MDLLNIRHSRIIEDPFPKETHKQKLYEIAQSVKPWFHLIVSKPTIDISIWKAYQMGYDKAYKEIEARLPDSLPILETSSYGTVLKKD